MARPSKYTPEREKRLLDALRAGGTRRAAAGYAGISEDTLAKWMRRYAGLSDGVVLAEHEAEMTYVAALQKSAVRGNVKSITFWLINRRHADWSHERAVRIEHEAKVEFTEMSVEEARQWAEFRRQQGEEQESRDQGQPGTLPGESGARTGEGGNRSRQWGFS